MWRVAFIVVVAVVGAVVAPIAVHGAAAAATGSVVIQVNAAPGAYATGFCLQPGDLVLGSGTCSDGSTQYIDSVAPGAQVTRNLAAGTYNAGVASLGPIVLGGVGPVTVVAGQTVTCTFSMTDPPSCVVGAPPQGTVIIKIGETAGSYATGFCLQPGNLVVASGTCSDGSQQYLDFLAAGASSIRKLAAGTYNAGVAALNPITMGGTGSVDVVDGQTQECTFTMAAPPACVRYDGNGDGVPDDQQTNVGSATTPTGQVVTVAAPDNSYTVSGVTTASVPADSPAPAPMPLGVLSFTVKLPDGATTADVDVVLPAGTHPTQYLKLRGGQWKDFTSHTTIAGDVVTLHLTDNDEFDTDLAPGVIGDPGAPALGYRFGGFLKPLHEGVNDAHAGRTVPVKWTITDAHGAPIADPASFVNVSSRPCAGGASTVETPTGKGLKYRRGVWQWNWKTPKSYAGQCRDMSLNLADGVTTRVVEVQF